MTITIYICNIYSNWGNNICDITRNMTIGVTKNRSHCTTIINSTSKPPFLKIYFNLNRKNCSQIKTSIETEQLKVEQKTCYLNAMQQLLLLQIKEV